MPMHEDMYIGEWALIPELCQYQEGHAPSSAHYSISLKDQDVSFSIDWVDMKEKHHSLKFGGPFDGSIQPLNGGKSEISFTRVDKMRMDSSTYHDGFEAMYVHRKVSQDGNLMVVMTVHNHDNDSSTRNFQVYRRV